MDYLPKAEIDGQAFQLARPLTAVEYVVGGLPLVLMFVGGALGGLSGAVGTVFNYRLMRTDADTVVKGAGVFGITVASLVMYVMLAVLAQATMGR